jgi:hypothetical protein
MLALNWSLRLLDLEGQDSSFVEKMGPCWPCETSSHPRRFESSDENSAFCEAEAVHILLIGLQYIYSFHNCNKAALCLQLVMSLLPLPHTSVTDTVEV